MSAAGAPPDLDQLYCDRQARFRQLAEQLEGQSSRTGNLRGLTFGGLVIAGGMATFGSGGAVAGGIAGACGIAFAVLVRRHAAIIEEQERQRRWERANADAHARVTGQWHDLPQTGTGLVPPGHPYADDLDCFGRGSIFQRISVAHTRFGERSLARWLTEAAPHGEIVARQKAVAELAPQLDFRQGLEAQALALTEKRGKNQGVAPPPDPEPLLRWAETPAELVGRSLVIALAWILPLLTCGGMVAAFGFGQSTFFWVVPVLGQIALAQATKEATTLTFQAVSATEGAFLRYGAMLRQVENLETEASWIQARKDRLLTTTTESGAPSSTGDQLAPSQSMRRFRRLVGWYDLRHNGMIHPFVNVLTSWDIHCTVALERWKLRSGRHARQWFEVLGELEAVSSLAGLLHDDPGCTLPELSPDSTRDGSPLAAFEATALGHPLLPAARRITNDVAHLHRGTALLVTGSNMSGKSTFLRSVGVACVLAFAGGPVCARRLALTRCHIGTSIRVSDSLASGVSHFYAELEKLKAVVDAAKGTMPVLFLLDEVLHGTNSRERQVGARWVIAELLERGAYGIVTTHDMELCRLTPALMERVRQHHFRESVRDDKMTFDYQLREGPVTAGNALRLMQLVGLDVPLE